MSMSTIAKIRARWLGLSATGRELAAGAVYLVFFTVGTVGHYIEATRTLMLGITPWFLLLFGISALLPVTLGRRWSVLIWGLATYIVTFALEAVGVATGAVFGEYVYGPTLGLKLFGVPLIIGFNWVVVVFASFSAADALTRRLPRGLHAVATVLLTGACAVIFDLVLEPVAIRFDYWAWDGVHVPLQNYLAWFVIAAAAAVPAAAAKIRAESRIPMIYVAVQFLFIMSLLPLTR